MTCIGLIWHRCCRTNIARHRISCGGKMKKGLLVAGSKNSLFYRISYVLYLILNGACIAIFSYQGYLWLKEHKWTAIPTHALIPDWSGVELSLPIVGPVITWMLDIELMYTVGIIAMIFYIPKIRREWKGKCTSHLARDDRIRIP